MLLNDHHFEPRVEGFYLKLMVNESTTNPLSVKLSSEPALVQIIDIEDSK